MAELIRPLKTEADYDTALKDIEQYFAKEPEPGSREGDRFDMLALLIEDYERKHWPIDAPDPIAAIRSHMENAGYRQAQFASLIGSRSRASEILGRKRHLTVEAIWKLNQKWGIPAECLIKPYRLKPANGGKHVRKRRDSGEGKR
ncbi:MAG: helix-turn-helix domain-containing protein [Stellaceae bacterium]